MQRFSQAPSEGPIRKRLRSHETFVDAVKNILVLDEITKRFGSVIANDGVNLSVRRGTVHALLGENGAGKTTLMNILYGLYRPDAGRIVLRGRPVRFASPKDAILQGIGMIHQQFLLVAQFTVAENIVLGLPPRRHLFMDLARVEQDIEALSDAYRLHVDPRVPIWQLPVGTQQRVEILKALYRKADLLVLDEPTSVLTPTETEALFEVLRRLVAEGRSVILISHKLEEILRVSDEVTVMRRGRVVDTVPTAETTAPGLARMMVGRDVVLRLDKPPRLPGEVVLEVRDLTARNDREVPGLRGVSFGIRMGEIFGVAGVDGNGQSELVEVIAGLRPSTAGQVLLKGRNIAGLSPREIIARRIAYIPSDRNRVGLILDFSIAENLVLKQFHNPPYSRYGILDAKMIGSNTEALAAQFDIRMSSIHQVVRQLSGGNQQKVALAREVAGEPDVIVAVQPTRGLDVGASEYVMRTILKQRARGSAVLYVSTELDEVLSMSDRVGVLFGGKLMGIVDPAATPVEEISLMMMGSPLAAGADVSTTDPR